MAKFTVELLHPDKVPKLPCGAIQIQAVSYIGDMACGSHLQLYALCEDGSIWCKYQSDGHSNVPVDGYWYNQNLDVTRKVADDEAETK
jgi:hypothetical protein